MKFFQQSLLALGKIQISSKDHFHSPSFITRQKGRVYRNTWVFFGIILESAVPTINMRWIGDVAKQSHLCLTSFSWLLRLSIQEPIDCDPGSCGCHHGNHISVFAYIKNNGIALVEDYPFVSETQPCYAKNILHKPRVFINDVTVLNKRGLLGEDELKKAISMRPVMVILKVGYEFFEFKGGIFRTETKDPKWGYHAV
ncbi:putative glycyl endopeptidase [Medicago truncatula]|uniref:Putative glycyl endopeptidase n=1 Tax=Medicago truncatula TaxID=3880 RepID=A0A396IKU7_MEDTR|nr:putative glycyl endopeptidase [Medicago truncatula]